MAAALQSDSLLAQPADFEARVIAAAVKYKGRLIPPVFVVAYTNPMAADQKGQEAIVAKYPMALVAQGDEPMVVQWRDDIRQKNPNIILLGYQMTILETIWSGGGPGHRIMKRAQNSWIVGSDGQQVRVEEPQKRVYDPRSDEWRNAFLEACDATLASYPYDGLILDQCIIIHAHNPYPAVREEMRIHLQDALLELRRRHPNAILIANSAHRWRGLNGVMFENRERELINGRCHFIEHVHPEINLATVKLKDLTATNVHIRERLTRAISCGAFFSAGINYDQISWFPVFDEVIDIVARAQR